MDQEILDIQRRAGILDEQGEAGMAGKVQGVTGRGTDPLAQLSTETFLQIVNLTLQELGQLRPDSMSEQQRIALARRVIAHFKGGGQEPAAQAQAGAGADPQAGQRSPQTAAAAGDPLA